MTLGCWIFVPNFSNFPLGPSLRRIDVLLPRPSPVEASMEGPIPAEPTNVNGQAMDPAPRYYESWRMISYMYIILYYMILYHIMLYNIT